MGSFIESATGVAFPTHYREACPDLRLRVYDPTEDDLPEWVPSVEIGDHLRGLVTWGLCVVPEKMLNVWGCSFDELLATATEQIVELPTQTRTLTRRGGTVVMRHGHPWVSSLLIRIDDELKGSEGAIVAIPTSDIMMTAPVLGESTVDSLEVMMLLCEELYDPVGGISPHVWWAWENGLYRITDRVEDGRVDFEPARNVSAFYLARALEHLVNPCEECGRSGPAENAVVR